MVKASTRTKTKNPFSLFKKKNKKSKDRANNKSKTASKQNAVAVVPDVRPTIDERAVRAGETFRRWEALEDGGRFQYACREFVKGFAGDEDRLLKRITITEQNNLQEEGTTSRYDNDNDNNEHGSSAVVTTYRRNLVRNDALAAPPRRGVVETTTKTKERREGSTNNVSSDTASETDFSTSVATEIDVDDDAAAAVDDDDDDEKRDGSLGDGDDTATATTASVDHRAIDADVVVVAVPTTSFSRAPENDGVSSTRDETENRCSEREIENENEPSAVADETENHRSESENENENEDVAENRCSESENENDNEDERTAVADELDTLVHAVEVPADDVTVCSEEASDVASSATSKVRNTDKRKKEPPGKVDNAEPLPDYTEFEEKLTKRKRFLCFLCFG